MAGEGEGDTTEDSDIMVDSATITEVATTTTTTIIDIVVTTAVDLMEG
jgi:hypothetical protein